MSGHSITAHSAPEESLAVAARLADAVSRGDAEALRDIYAPDLEFVMYASGPQRRTRDEAVAAFAALSAQLAVVELEVVDRQPTPLGYVARQVMHATGPNGGRLSVPHCLVTRVRGGRIARIDEYVDGSLLERLLRAPARPSSRTDRDIA